MPSGSRGGTEVDVALAPDGATDVVCQDADGLVPRHLWKLACTEINAAR